MTQIDTSDGAAARATAKRTRVVTYLHKSRQLQARMKVIIAIGVVASLALFAVMGPAWGIGFLVLTGIVGGTSFWITAGHIRDFKQTLRDLDDAAGG